MPASAKRSSALIVTTPSDREIVLTRVFQAPRHLVFEALTRPEHVPQWYGPRGWTLPVCEMDLRAGGAWRYVMQSPDGRKVGMRGVYREIVAPRRLVSTESFDDYPGESLNTLTLTEENGKTRVTVHVQYESKAIRDAVIHSGMERGAGETYDRLAEHLAEMLGSPTAAPELVITRTGSPGGRSGRAVLKRSAPCSLW